MKQTVNLCKPISWKKSSQLIKYDLFHNEFDGVRHLGSIFQDNNSWT